MESEFWMELCIYIFLYDVNTCFLCINILHTKCLQLYDCFREKWNVLLVKLFLFQDRGTATEPPPRATFSGNVTQWEIFDAYQEDFDKQVMLLKWCYCANVSTIPITWMLYIWLISVLDRWTLDKDLFTVELAFLSELIALLPTPPGYNILAIAQCNTNIYPVIVYYMSLFIFIII